MSDISLKLDTIPAASLTVDLLVNSSCDSDACITQQDQVINITFKKSENINTVEVRLSTNSKKINENPIRVEEIVLDEFYRHPKFLLGECNNEVSDTLYSTDHPVTFSFKWPFFKSFYLQ